MRRKLKIKVLVIEWMPLLLIFLYPYSVNNLLPKAAQYSLYAIGLIISGVSIVFCFIKKKFNPFLVLLTIYCSIMAISTLVNHGNIISVLFINPDFPIIKMVGTCAFLTYLITCSRREKYLEILSHYYTLLIVINLISIVLFPNGMYVTGQEENFILGFDNTHCVTFFFAITVATLRDRGNNPGKFRFSRETKWLIVLIHISVIICRSGTTLVQLALTDIVYFMVGQKRLMKIFNAHILFVLNILFSIFLIGVFPNQGNGMIAFVAENILNKDVTFTRRTFVWSRALLAINEKPILGHGWDMELAASKMFFYHAHNQYLTDLYYGGRLMLLVLVGIVFVIGKKLEYLKNDSIYPVLLAVFFASIFHWNTESMHLPMQFATFACIYCADYVINTSHLMVSKRKKYHLTRRKI